MILIVDYGLGNLASVQNMVRKVGGDCRITSDPEEIGKADRLLLPGVGHFAKGMQQLHQRGLVQALDMAVRQRGVPILGICLGMQLMARRSEEGPADGLGWFDADVRRFDQARLGGLKTPHMGWSEIHVHHAHPVLPSRSEMDRFYFVHSYHIVCDHERDAVASCDYGYPFTCAVAHDNIIGVQFHPEKSHRFGMAVVERFIRWTP